VTNPAVADQNASGPASTTTRRALLGLGAVGAALAVSRTVSAAPTEDDRAIAAFAIGAELAAGVLYTGVDGDLWTVIAHNHRAFAERLAGISGVSADAPNETIMSTLAPMFEGDVEAAALELENTLAATHAELIASVADVELAGAMASIIASESRHAAVIATQSDAGLDAVLVNTATAVVPEA